MLQCIEEFRIALPMFEVSAPTTQSDGPFMPATMQGSVPDSERVLKEIEYDIIGSPAANFSFAVAFPFHSACEGAPPCATLIREYCQGPNCVMYNLPTGAFDGFLLSFLIVSTGLPLRLFVTHLQVRA